MIFCAFPGMMVRLINDCVKPFFQNQSEELLNEFGRVYFTYFVVVAFPLCWVVVSVLDFGVGCFGLAILIYESGGLVICFYFYLYKAKKETKDASLPLLKNYGFFLKKSFLNFLADWPLYIVWDILNFIVAFTHSTEVLAGFSLLCNTAMTATMLSAGIIIQIRAVVNQVLGTGKHKTAKQIFSRFQWVSLCLSLFLICLLYLIMYLQSALSLYDNSEMLKLMKKSNFLFCLRTCGSCVFYSLYANGMRLTEQQPQLLLLSYLTMPAIPISTFLGSVYFKGEINGICVGHICVYVPFSMVMRSFVMEFDWGSIGALEEFGKSGREEDVE